MKKSIFVLFILVMMGTGVGFAFAQNEAGFDGGLNVPLQHDSDRGKTDCNRPTIIVDGKIKCPPPPPPQEIFKDIEVQELCDHECDDSEWHFVINQIDDEDNAPENIYVEWENGDDAYIPLDTFTGGVAHYRTTENLDSLVKSAGSSIYEDWDGQFNLSHGPCKSDEPDPEPKPVTLIATKIVCDSEEYLPNWSYGEVRITNQTAIDYVAEHSQCHLESDWYFQYGDQDVTDPGADFVGEAGNGWATFGPTNAEGVATVSVAGAHTWERTWVREVLKNEYVSFTYPGENDNVSAEMWCDVDVENYDNYEELYPEAGGTYYCVAFNALKEEVVENQPPVANAGADVTIFVGVTTTLSGSGSTDSDGTVVSYLWTHPDGSTTTGMTAEFSTTTVGTYVFTLVVTDNDGATSTPDSVQVIVQQSSGGGGTTPPQCSDGSDNDADGLGDYPRDPGCESSQDNDELDPVPPSGGGGGGSSSRSSGTRVPQIKEAVVVTTCQLPVVPIGFDVLSGVRNDKQLELFYFAPGAKYVLAQYVSDDGVLKGYGFTTSQSHLSLKVPQNGVHYWVRVFAMNDCGLSGWTSWVDPLP